MVAGLFMALICLNYLISNVHLFRVVTNPQRSRIGPTSRRGMMSLSMSSNNFLSDVKDAISGSVGRNLGEPALGGSYGGGGGGCSTGEITFSTGETFFLKRGWHSRL